MRIATYNVEWFTELFDDAGEPLADDRWSGRRDITRREQLEALGIVFTALDADIIMVIEAPDESRKRSGKRALERFAETFELRARRALLGFPNQTQQEIIMMYDPDVVDAVHDPLGNVSEAGEHDPDPRFDTAFWYDLDTDAAPEPTRWSKPPLEAKVTTKTGVDLRLIGVHAKSKAPHGARDDREAMRIAIENRRKQLAQCLWLRKRVDQHLAAGESLVVLGDLNDGPGLDEYEKLFGRSSLEIVLGEGADAQLYDPHANMALRRKVGAQPATARFKIAPDGHYLSVLLDYIMVSPDLRQHLPRWRIWHPFDNEHCYRVPELREALLAASDHFPVSLDIDL